MSRTLLYIPLNQVITLVTKTQKLPKYLILHIKQVDANAGQEIPFGTLSKNSAVGKPSWYAAILRALQGGSPGPTPLEVELNRRIYTCQTALKKKANVAV